MANHALINTLYEIGAIQFGQFTLKSNKTSPIYLNLRKIISYPNLHRAIAEALLQTVADCEYDLICGVPYAALPLATCLSLSRTCPLIFCRKEKKEHGTKQQIEGVYEAGQRVLLVEDVITTGGSILETTTLLQQAGLVVNDVLAIVCREEEAERHLATQFKVHRLFEMREILDTLLHSTLVPSNEKNLIAQFQQENNFS